MERPRDKEGRVKRTYSPEVVDQNVEDTQNQDQEGGTELSLEAHDDHDAGDEADEGDADPPGRPLAAEDEADEEEDEEHATRQLEVHLAILLVECRQTGKGLGFPDPRVGQDHKQATADGEVAKEEVQVEDQAIAERLDDDDTHETSYRIVGVLPGDDERRATQHSDDVHNEEEVR